MTSTKKNTKNLFSLVFTVALICLMTTAIIPWVKGASAVDLGSAGNFVILAESAIANNPTSAITGDIGLSPTTGASITGLVCSEVTGLIYTIDAAGPDCRNEDPTLLTTAINDMHTAYNTARDLPAPDYTNVGTGGNIGGLTLGPGLYTFTTAVTITDDVILSGSPSDVWVFQIPGTSSLGISSGKNVILSGGAQAANIFWVVGGATTLESASGFNGTILDNTAITLNNGATLNGRAFAQTAVTLDGNTVTFPTAAPPSPPVADFTFTPASGTAPLTVTFTNTSTSASTITSWAWNFGDFDTTNSTVQNPVHTYATAGTYTVSLTVTDVHAATDTKTVANAVTVYQAPVADFTFTPASGPVPLTVTFTDNSTPAGQIASWAWNFGDFDTTNSTVQNPVHTYATAGTYTVLLMVTDGNAATDTKTVANAVVTQDLFEITLTTLPIVLTLNPGTTTTNTDIEFYVNSSTSWQVTAYDAAETNGFMTDDISNTHLSEPFMVRQNIDNQYVNLPITSVSATRIQTGSAEKSSMPYTLGIQQEVKMSDPVLSGINVYRIVVTLTVGTL